MLKPILIALLWFACLSSWAMRDPTMPATQAALSDVAKDTVTMILVSSQRKLAVIDGTFVSEGDTVGEQKIIKIEPDYVILQNTITGEQKRTAVTGTDIKVNAR